jgi:two-component system, LytTR family, sensor kinase
MFLKMMNIKSVNFWLQFLLWLLFCYTVILHFIDWLPNVGIHLSIAKIISYSITYVITLSLFPYINSFVLIDRYYRKQKIFLYGLLVSLGIAISLCLFVAVDYVFIYPGIPNWFFIPVHFLSRLPYVFIFTLAIYLFKIRTEFYLQKQVQLKLEKEKTEVELQFLKAQINPHFLFNTLNNIQSLSFTQPQKAAETIVNLSNLFRYITYDGKRDKVTLLEEINYIKNYLALSVMKKSWLNKVVFQTEHVDNGIKIEPLLLINFIENAFKHGSLDDDTDFIKIKIETDSNNIFFTCINTFISANKTSGMIGLQNVKKRLDIVYADKYDLSNSIKKNEYHVNLIIHYAA